MFRTDTLTVSRVFRILDKYDIKDMPNSENIMLSSIAMTQLNENLLPELFDAAGLEKSGDNMIDVETISELFSEINKHMISYSAEIEKRKHHATNIIKMWQEDEEPKSPEENLYQSDYYLQCYMGLAKEGIQPEKLNLYESFILYEEIVCNHVKEGISQMLSMLEDKYKTFVLVQKEMLKHANFTAFVLDIYDAVEKMYNEMNEKEKSKK